MHACILVACILFYKIKLKLIHYFIAALLKKRDHSNQQNKTSSITTEKKQLTDINHSFTFNSKVSSIVDDYLFYKETAKSGLKRKREPENVVGTKKSKKRLRRL